MASSTRSWRTPKHEGNSSTKSGNAASKLKNIKDSPTCGSTATSARNTRNSTNSVSTAIDSSSLRRSFRETPTKKTPESSPSSRKSERPDNQAISTLSDMKEEGSDKKRPHSPLRRSERIEKNGISSSPGPKKQNESSSPPLKKKKVDNKNGKTVVTGMENQSNDKNNTKGNTMSKKKKRLDARRYRALLQPKKDEFSDDDDDMCLKDDNSALKGSSSNSASNNSKKVHIGESNGQKEDKHQGIFSFDNSKEAADGSSSSSRQLTELTTGGDGPRKSARLSGKNFFEHKSNVSKSTASSIQSSLVGLTTKDNTGCAPERGSLGIDNNHDASKLDIEEVESSGLVPYTSDGKFLVTDTGGNENICNLEISKADVSSSSPCETTSKDNKRCTVCNKLKRVDGVTEANESCLCGIQRKHDLMPPPTEDRGTFEASDDTCASEGRPSDVDLKESVAVRTDSNMNACVTCNHPGQLLSCDGKGCNRSYHLSCLNPPLQDVPPGIWHCHLCIKKKVESGVYSVSEGIESVWDVKEGTQNEKHYFVKYKGLAHVHNQWVPESQMLLEAPLLVVKFEKKHQKEKVSRWKQCWTEPQRLLQKRQLRLNLAEEYISGHGDKNSCSYIEWLVKWKGLGYENATWELENSPFLCSPSSKALVDEFERHREEAKKRSDPLRTDEALQVKKSPFHKLTMLPDDCPTGLDNDHLCSVNRLREFWHKSQNAIFVDDVERVIKTVLFVSALKSHICRPILIISTVHSLSLWETEFRRLAPSINVVVYTGTKDIRKLVRTVEFYEEGGCVMFQVLISHPDAVIEDFDVLDCIGWEALIVDESQNPRVSKHLEQLKDLTTEFRLLLLSAQLKDNVAEYLNLTSFLEPGGKVNRSVNSKCGTNDTAGALAILKEKLTRYLAYERKPGLSKFIEYWVPAQLSNVQLELYCSTLVSNLNTLRSCSKTDHVGALRDTLISVRKCCDHPYLVDKSLQSSLMKDLPPEKLLDTGVKASGKLQLLDGFLREIKNQGLRVLILFQSVGGAGRDSIGDILDDFIRQRFGPDSYERVDSGLIMSKKLATLSKFNDKAKGRFVFLVENRACLPSIKLSSVDAAVIFNSDWNPLNDLRALQRIHMESQSGHVKVFRLYSACTVEEKVLIFAKQDMILDSNVQNISPSNSHLLLSWGALHLWNELDEFHRHYSEDSIDNCLLNDSTLKFLNDVLVELVGELTEKPENNRGQCLLLIKAQQSGSSYSRNICLVGEKDGISSLDKDPPSFWSNLLETKFPNWRFICEASQRIRRKVKYFEKPLKMPEVENNEGSKKRRKLSTNTVDPICLQTWLEDKTKGLNKESKVVDDNSGAGFVQAASVPTATTPPFPSNMPQEPEKYGRRSNVGSQSAPSIDRSINDVSSNVQAFSTSDDASKLYKSSTSEAEGMHGAQRTFYLCLKPQISELCDILKLPDDVKELAHLLLEYIMNNHHVNREPETILQAFKFSLCWRAASFLKHKVDHRECLALAKKYLNYMCTEEEVDVVYSKLRMLKKRFSQIGVMRLEEEPDSLENQSPASRIAETRVGDSEQASACVQELGAIKTTSDYHRSSGLCSEQKEAGVNQPPPKSQQNLVTLKDALLEKQVDLIDMVYSKRADALVLKQQEELSDFNVHREEEKMRLKSEHDDQLELIRSIHTDYTVRNDKIKFLNQDFSRKMANFDQHMKVQRRKLADMQEDAKNKETEIRNLWVQEAIAGTLADSFDNLPLTESGFTLEEFMETTKQDEACDSSRNIMSASMTASDPMCCDIGITENSTETSLMFSSRVVQEMQPPISCFNTIAEKEPIGTFAEILEAIPPNMSDMESAEPNEMSAQNPDPALDVCNDVIASVPGVSTGITVSLGDMPSTISIRRTGDVHIQTSFSADVAEAEPSQLNGTFAEMPDSVACNMAGVESIEPNVTSADISVSAKDSDKFKDNGIPFFDSEAVTASGDHHNTMDAAPLRSNGANGEIPETVPCNTVEVESLVRTTVEISAANLPARNVDTSRDIEPSSEPSALILSGSPPESTHMMPSLAASQLPQQTGVPVLQPGNMGEVNSLESSRTCAGVSPTTLSSKGDSYVDVEAQMNTAGDIIPEILTGSTSARTTKEMGIHGSEDVNKSDGTCFGSSSLQNHSELPEMRMVGGGSHEIDSEVAIRTPIDRNMLEAEDNFDETHLGSSMVQNLVDLPSLSHASANTCHEKSASSNLVLSVNEHLPLAVAVTTGCGLSSPQLGVTVSSVDVVTSQVQPNAHHTDNSNSTLLPVPPVGSVSAEICSQACTALASPSMSLRNGEIHIGGACTTRSTELSLQQPDLSTQMPAEQNHLDPPSNLRPVFTEGICCSTSQAEIPGQQLIATAIMQPGQSSHLVSPSVAHQPLPLPNMASERAHPVGIGSTGVPQDPGSNLLQILPMAAWVHPQALHPDPLQNELTRLRKQVELRTKMHEEKKLQLKLECEQEIERVRQKYDALLKYDESAFNQDKKILDTIYSKVLVNQILAEEFRAKFIDAKGGSSASSSQGRSSNPMQQFLQTSQASHVPRPTSTSSSPHVPNIGNLPLVANPGWASSTVPTATLGAQSSSAASGPASFMVRHSHPVVGAGNVGSQFSPMLAARPNRHGVTDIRVPAPRAPAPHLHRFRPPTPMMTSLVPPLSSQLSAQQQPRSSLGAATLPSAATQPVHPLRPPLARPYQPAMSLPRPQGRDLPAVELPRDIVGNGSADLVNLSPSELGSSHHRPLPTNLPVNGPVVATSTAIVTNPTNPSADLVCLSDDE